jgi:hypothetical protein
VSFLDRILDRYLPDPAAPDPAEVAELRDTVVALTDETVRLRLLLNEKSRQAATALHAATIAHAANDELTKRATQRQCPRCVQTAHLAEQNELLHEQLDDLAARIEQLVREVES